MPTLIIDGKEITVKDGATIMEAAKLLGVYIPHFCYHPKLSVSGNCRMCLVEVEKSPKPVVACAMPVNDGMVVKTNSDMALESRKAVMEMLLINHPLDCPVCDQGGECSLQDLAMKYGPDRARFHEDKRQVENWNLGAFIETEMNRCIQCTRCIRFSTEIAGVEEMGGIARGDHLLIGPAVDLELSSELSGNLAQVCPVGALNLKPFHFQARGWELKQSEGICNQCAVGCHISRDYMEGKVKRVMASSCDAINDMWICDKGRFSYDGLTVGRNTYPSERRNNMAPTPITLNAALDRAAEIIKQVKPEEVAGLADDRQCGEDLYAFQDFMRRSVGTPHMDHRMRLRDYSGDKDGLTRADLLMNTSLVQLASADVILLVGMDPRKETPMLNLRIRKAALNGASVMAINPRRMDANLPSLRQIILAPGKEVAFLTSIADALGGQTAGDEEVGRIAGLLAGSKRPAILLGEYAVNHPSAEMVRRAVVKILEGCNGLRPDWNGYNRVRYRGNAAGAQDLGVVPHRGPGYTLLDNPGLPAMRILEEAVKGNIKVLVLMGANPLEDAVDTTLAKEALAKAKVIYIGPYANESSKAAQVVIPGLVASEKNATYTNCEGRAQHNNKAVDGPAEAREEWRILRALSDRFAQSLSYNDLKSLRAAMAKDHRYAMEHVNKEGVMPACDHSPVTRGLAVENGVTPQGDGIVLILEPSFLHDDPMAANSDVLVKQDKGNCLLISPKMPRPKRLATVEKCG
ncbi:MAG: NADH-quinone oxidoreductase subunit NuoG [Magnetococcales bacterium]|nr:NADH-quinone oxidoreductase subunit NuoG [Magnetococcales bacterium]